MDRDEQKEILEFIGRAVRDDPAAPLRPMDLEADAIIRAMFVRIPEAAYRVTMLAIAQARELEALTSRLTQQAPQPRASLFRRLFAKPPSPPRPSEVHVLDRTLNKV